MPTPGCNVTLADLFACPVCPLHEMISAGLGALVRERLSWLSVKLKVMSELPSNARYVEPFRAKAQSSVLSYYAQHQSRSIRQNQLYKIQFWCLLVAGQTTELRDLLLCLLPSLGLHRGSTSTPLTRLTLVIRTRQTQPRTSFHSHFLRSASSLHHFSIQVQCVTKHA